MAGAAFEEELYPETDMIGEYNLEVSQDPPHTLHIAEYGNPDGEPVIVLHGGPGGGCPAVFARFFDPEHYRIIMPDQRGAGKSVPHASLEDNTTQHLISDINAVRDHLGVEGKAHIWGGSWGSTLALAYGIEHPDLVESMNLRGIFLGRKQDIDFFLQGDAVDPGNPALQGTGQSFPEAWKKYVEFIPEQERQDIVTAYLKRLTSDNQAVREEAAVVMSGYEGSTAYLSPVDLSEDKFGELNFAIALARTEMHYMHHGLFLGDDPTAPNQNYILDNVHKLSGIPIRVAQGRYDAICGFTGPTEDLVNAVKAAGGDIEVEYTIAGHSCTEPDTARALVAFSNELKDIGSRLKLGRTFDASGGTKLSPAG